MEDAFNLTFRSHGMLPRLCANALEHRTTLGSNSQTRIALPKLVPFKLNHLREVQDTHRFSHKGDQTTNSSLMLDSKRAQHANDVFTFMEKRGTLYKKLAPVVHRIKNPQARYMSARRPSRALFNELHLNNS